MAAGASAKTNRARLRTFSQCPPAETVLNLMRTGCVDRPQHRDFVVVKSDMTSLASKFACLLQVLGDPIEAPDEETYELFAQDLPSQNLGFIDAKASTLELSIAGRDLTVHQSPAVLTSDRTGGTTGAVVWKITPLFAEWISSSKNLLFSYGLLGPSSHVAELGCGISALVGLLLAPHIAGYVLTDQPYVMKLVEQNIAENRHAKPSKASTSSAVKGRSSAAKGKSRSSHHTPITGQVSPNQIQFHPLDWEQDTPTPSLTLSPAARSFDAVIACDCIYNEALINPLVSTCVDICRLRAAEADSSPDEAEPCVCVNAQQLRDPDIFEAWLTRFTKSFYAWRVPDQMLLEGLRSNAGFVVHVGVLKEAVTLPRDEAASVWQRG